MSAELDWSDDAFFDAPERGSVDGGTTSAGASLAQRQPALGPLHAHHVLIPRHVPGQGGTLLHPALLTPGDVVLDPFSGRGTTPLQARVEGRKAICNDLNPLAYVLSRAKSRSAVLGRVHTFLDGLRPSTSAPSATRPDVPPDIRMLYHDNTLKQLCYMRDRLLSKTITTWSPGRVHARAARWRASCTAHGGGTAPSST